MSYNKELAQNYYQTNRDNILHRVKKYYSNNKEKVKKYQKVYSIQNKVKIKERDKEYYNLNKEKSKLRYQLNKGKRQLYYQQIKKERVKKLLQDPVWRLQNNLRTRIRAAIKTAKTKKYNKTVELLGCTIEEARKHIESLWMPGMTWDNYGIKGWHIDHITPCCTFDLTDPEQQKQCFHYTNLRPLWAKDNLRRPRDGSDIC